MKRHLRYEEPVRSSIKAYGMSAYCTGVRRAMVKDIGHRLAKSGVMQKGVHAQVRVRYLLTNVDPYRFGGWNDMYSVLMPRESRCYERDYEKLSNTRDNWKSVPWASADWFRSSAWVHVHALHMATEEKMRGQVAFADNTEKWEAERYTTMKPGRYLAKFFGDVLSEDDIRMWAQKVAATLLPAELHYAESNAPDEWERVYAGGPDSCMSGVDYAHCARVYAHSKSVLRLAYLMQGDVIKARCIVREDTTPPQYIRCYPNTNTSENQTWYDAMRYAVEGAGYRAGSLYGVLLEAVGVRGRGEQCYVMPWLDSGNGDSPYVALSGDEGYFRVGDNGTPGQNTSGTVSIEELYTCDDCGSEVPEDSISYVESSSCRVCESCCSENYTGAIGRNGYTDTYRIDECVEVGDDWYVIDFLGRNGIYECAVSGTYHHEGDMVRTSQGMVHPDNAVMLAVADSGGCEWAIETDAVTTHDGREIHRDDAREVERAADEDGVVKTDTCHWRDNNPEGESE